MFKSSMKNTIKAAICLVVIQGCAGAEVYKQNCVDIASSAGHTYERMFKDPAMVATGYDGSTYHAQAYCIKDDKMVWLTSTYAFDNGHYTRETVAILAVGVDQELDTIDGYFTLEEFDKKYNAHTRRSNGLRRTIKPSGKSSVPVR